MKGNLNFTWIIATTNHVIKYENLETETIKVEDKIQSFKYWINVNSCNYSKFLNFHYELAEYIKAKAIMFDDGLMLTYDKNDQTNLNSKLRNADFDLSVYKRRFDSDGKYLEEFVGRIKYRHKNLYRKLSFELKEDIIRSMKENQRVIANKLDDKNLAEVEQT